MPPASDFHTPHTRTQMCFAVFDDPAHGQEDALVVTVPGLRSSRGEVQQAATGTAPGEPALRKQLGRVVLEETKDALTRQLACNKPLPGGPQAGHKRNTSQPFPDPTGSPAGSCWADKAHTG